MFTEYCSKENDLHSITCIVIVSCKESYCPLSAQLVQKKEKKKTASSFVFYVILVPKLSNTDRNRRKYTTT